MNKKFHKLKDEEIVSHIIQTQDTDSYSLLYDRYSQKVYNKSLSFFKNREKAQDVTHDIFIKVFLKLPSFQNQSQFSSWIYTITYNHCVDVYKKETKSINENEYFDYVTQEEYDEEELFKIKFDRLDSILQQIPSEQKMMLLMKYQDDLTIEEISVLLQIKTSTTKMRIKRSRDRVVKMYKELYN